MEKPEWRKTLEEATAQSTTNLNNHKDTANIHRVIYVSTAEPTSTDGKNGDIWLVYQA